MKQLLKNEATIAIVLMSSFVIIVSMSSIYTYSNIYHGDACTCTIPIYLLTSLLPSIGLVVGAIVAYLLSIKLKTAKSKRKTITKALFKLFDHNERKIIKEIINNDSITQAGIGRKTGLIRVKVHRTISNLENKKVIRKIEKGKTYSIELTEEFDFLRNI